VPAARAKRPHRRTLYDAVMQTRLLAIFAAVVAATALFAGCSSNSQDSAKALPDAATLLKQSSDTTRSQSSMHLKIAVAGQIKELPIESLEGDLTTTPAVAAQGTANIVFLGQRLEGVDFAVVGGTLYGALTKGSYQDLGPAADIYDPSAILNPDTGLANLQQRSQTPQSTTSDRRLTR